MKSEMLSEEVLDALQDFNLLNYNMCYIDKYAFYLRYPFIINKIKNFQVKENGNLEPFGFLIMFPQKFENNGITPQDVMEFKFLEEINSLPYKIVENTLYYKGMLLYNEFYKIYKLSIDNLNIFFTYIDKIPVENAEFIKIKR